MKTHKHSATPAAPVLPLPSAGPVWFIGIGGMGMAPLAGYFAGLGYTVWGTEDGTLETPVKAYLQELSIPLKTPLQVLEKLNTAPPAAVVYTCAVPAADARLAALKKAGIPCFTRPQALASIAAGKQLIAITGSHGKTTTTGLAIQALENAGISFDYILGGFFTGNMPPARANSSELNNQPSNFLVAELDESRGTFEGFAPYATVLTTLGLDHANVYTNTGELTDAFSALCARTGAAVIHLKTDALAQETAAKAATAHPGLSTIPCAPANVEGAPLPLNAHNAALVEGLLQHVFQMPQTQARAAVPTHAGLYRRQETLCTAAGAHTLTDYAHHPSEIKALLAHLRATHPGQRIHAIFQPHRYTRTAALAEGFAHAFAESLIPTDTLHILPIYPADETEADAVGEGGTIISTQLIQRAYTPLAEEEPRAPLTCVEDMQQLEPLLNKAVALSKEGCVVAFIGAGSVHHMGRVWAKTRQLMLQELLPTLREHTKPATRFEAEVPLHKKTTLRVGGPAWLFAEPCDAEDLAHILQTAAKCALPWVILGKGSNCVVNAAGYPGLVIQFGAQQAWRVFEPSEAGTVRVGAGVRLQSFSARCGKLGLGGFEFLEGIPGTIGGSVAMNAGAYGDWVFDLVESVELITPSGQQKTLPASQFNAGYRCVEGLGGGIVTAATLRIDLKRTPMQIAHTMREYTRKRTTSQPREPSAGSMFKNPENDHAGRLIEAAGLKGAACGGAQISPVHANFIVNVGGASATDVITLMHRARTDVQEMFGVTLETEVKLIGRTWADVWAHGPQMPAPEARA